MYNVHVHVCIHVVAINMNSLVHVMKHVFLQILKKFLDKKDSDYSLHMIGRSRMYMYILHVYTCAYTCT